MVLNVSVAALSATSARLTWEPPPPEHHNGIIGQYLIRVTGVHTSEQFELSTENTIVAIGDLHPFYAYKFAVAAQTIAVGPYSNPATLQMPEAGKSIRLPLREVLLRIDELLFL